MDRLTRRGFLGGVAGMAASASVAGATSAASTARGSGAVDPSKTEPILIDFLGSPGPFNQLDQGNGEALSDERIANVRASGLSAINVTILGGTFEKMCADIAFWEHEIGSHPDVFVRVRTVDDVRQAHATGRLGLIYGFQGVGGLGDELEPFDVFARLGVRVMQLTYNGRDLVGDGCLEPGNAGLSRFGLEVLEHLNHQRVLVDLGHCGQQTTADAIAHSKVPVAISHSGCRVLADLPRNKRDEELRAMAERGGVVGIYLMPFLAAGRQVTGDDVVLHLEHALEVCGEDHVGIGSDLSITPLPDTEEFRKQHREFVEMRQKYHVAAPGESPDRFYNVPDFNHPRRLQMVGERLRARGHSTKRIEKILGGNWLRLLDEVWGAPAVAVG